MSMSEFDLAYEDDQWGNSFEHDDVTFDDHPDLTSHYEVHGYARCDKNDNIELDIYKARKINPANPDGDLIPVTDSEMKDIIEMYFQKAENGELSD